MKTYRILIIAVCLMLLMTSCGGNDRSTPVSTDANNSLSTLVTATLTAISSGSTPSETLPEELPASASKASLDDFQNRELVGENDAFSIYLINRSGGSDPTATGEVLVYNKSTDQVIKMNGSFSVVFGGGTIVFDDGKGEYVLLSIGTYSTRNGIVISLVDQKQAVSDFCLSSGQYGAHIFWEDYIFINNCDTFNNRPWGRGEASSIVAINLDTGAETIIAKSDLTHQYSVRIIEGNTFRFNETFVENEADWQLQDKQRTDEKSYDLTLLSSK